MTIFQELKRRNVFKVAAAYIIVAWLLMQVSDTLVPALRLPEWFNSGVAFVLILGFPVALIFAWAYELTPDGLKKEKAVDRTQSIVQQTGRKLDFAIIGLLALAVVYLVWDKFGTEPLPGTQDVRSSAEAGPEGSAGMNSIAVLPFANMSEDTGNEYFSDGISEEILNALAQVNELKVAGRTSSFAFKGRNEDLRLIGETLNVSHILEGSVRKAGNTVRVTAQLVSVKDGYHLWSETYDRELTDIFAIQDEIAASILENLKAQLVGGEQLVSSRTDPRAYEKYLQAKQLIYTRSHPELLRAVELLEEALALDDRFAPAWAQRGIVSMLLSDTQYGTIPFADAQAQARRFLEQALELDDGLAEAWAGLGLYYANQQGNEQSPLAIEHLERALAINPSLIDASNWLQDALRKQYRMEESVALLEEMFKRDPLYPPLVFNLQLGYAILDQHQRLEPVLRQVRPFLREDAGFIRSEAIQQALEGEYAESLPLAQKSYALNPTGQSNVGAYGRTLFYLNEFEQVPELPWTDPGFKVAALAYLGRHEEATMLGRQFFQATGVAGPYLNALVHAGEYQAAVRFVNDRWPDIEAFSDSQGVIFGFGSRALLNFAKACLETGRDEQFREAMRLVRLDHDRQMEHGAAWQVFLEAEAQYWTLAGDQQRAIDILETMVDEQGWVAAPRISRLFPKLRPLEGDPRYQALQARALEHLNRERVEAGLDALEPEQSRGP